MNKRVLIDYGLPIILFLLSIPFMIYFGNKSWKKDCCFFYNSSIEGVSKRVDIAKSYNILVLKKDKKNQQYRFVNKEYWHGGYHRSKKWTDVAEKGDSIYKAQYADTLFIFKQDGRVIPLELEQCCKE